VPAWPKHGVCAWGWEAMIVMGMCEGQKVFLPAGSLVTGPQGLREKVRRRWEKPLRRLVRGTLLPGTGRCSPSMNARSLSPSRCRSRGGRTCRARSAGYEPSERGVEEASGIVSYEGDAGILNELKLEGVSAPGAQVTSSLNIPAAQRRFSRRCLLEVPRVGFSCYRKTQEVRVEKSKW
jgi:hypothetical protein